MLIDINANIINVFASSQKFKELNAMSHHLVLLDVAIMSKKDASP